MIQRKIKEIEINTSGNVSYEPDMEEEYAAVLAQAEAHQDLRFQYNDKILILPWETVAQVNATYETAEVTAPHDDICGDEAQGRLVVTPNEPIGDIEIYNDDGCYVTPPSFYSGVTATFDGVPLTEQQMWEGMRVEVPGTTDGKLVVDCLATSVTYTAVYTYEGETCNVTVTQNATASDG